MSKNYAVSFQSFNYGNYSIGIDQMVRVDKRIAYIIDYDIGQFGSIIGLTGERCDAIQEEDKDENKITRNIL